MWFGSVRGVGTCWVSPLNAFSLYFMPEPTSQPVPRHLNIFLWLGGLGLVLGLLFPLFLAQYVRSERGRLAACDRQERLDCEPSVLWLLMK